MHKIMVWTHIRLLETPPAGPTWALDFGSPRAFDFGSPRAFDFGSPRAFGFGSPRAFDFGSPRAFDFGSPRALDFGSPRAFGFGSPRAFDFGSPRAMTNQQNASQTTPPKHEIVNIIKEIVCNQLYSQARHRQPVIRAAQAQATSYTCRCKQYIGTANMP